MIKESDLERFHSLKYTSAHTWRSEVMEVLWQILEGVSGGGYGKAKTMLKVADYLEQLHTETLPLSKTDPEKALGVYINIYRILLMVNAVSVGLNQKVANRLRSSLYGSDEPYKEDPLKASP